MAEVGLVVNVVCCETGWCCLLKIIKARMWVTVIFVVRGIIILIWTITLLVNVRIILSLRTYRIIWRGGEIMVDRIVEKVDICKYNLWCMTAGMVVAEHGGG
jgi:hypothetical protein